MSANETAIDLSPAEPRRAFKSTVQVRSLAARVGTRRKNSSKWASVSGVFLPTFTPVA